MPDDAVLLRQFAETRSEAAFAELVRRHIDAVYSSALRRLAGDTHLAEDVTQQVFVALARQANRVASHPVTSAWLHLTTRNLAAQAVRTEHRRRAREQQHAAAMPDDSPHPSSTADWSRLAPVIDSAIDQLNDRDRAAVLLRFIENRAFADIGRTLRISEDAARMRVDRALEKLRVNLARHGLSSTATALGLALTHHAAAAAPAGFASVTTNSVLLSAATPASASTSFFAMTISSKTAAFVAGAALLGALGTATYELHRASASNRELVAAHTRLESLRSRLTARQQALADAQESLGSISATSLVAPASKNSGGRSLIAPAPSSTAASPAWDPAAEGRALLRRHPRLRQAYIDLSNAQTNFRYAGFYEMAGLTPVQIAEFQRLEREHAGYGRTIGAGLKTVQLTLETGMSYEQVAAAKKSLLGEENFNKLRQYQNEEPARQLATQLASALAFSEQPLSRDQFAAIQQAILDARAVSMTSSGPHVDWSAVTARIQPVLAAEQLAALEAVRAQTTYDQAFSAAVSPPAPAPRPTTTAQR